MEMHNLKSTVREFQQIQTNALSIVSKGSQRKENYTDNQLFYQSGTPILLDWWDMKHLSFMQFLVLYSFTAKSEKLLLMSLPEKEVIKLSSSLERTLQPSI